MGYFGNVHESECDKHRIAIQEKLDGLAQEIKNKATDSQEVAAEAAKSTVAIEKKISGTATAIENILTDLVSYKETALSALKEVGTEKERLIAANKEVLDQLAKTQEAYGKIIEAKEQVDADAQKISEDVKKITTYLEQSADLPEGVAKTQRLLEESKTLSENISSVLNHSIKKKTEIDDLHKKIYGEDIKDSDGNAEHVDGLKDDLENAYAVLASKKDELASEIDKEIAEITRKHERVLAQQVIDFDQLVLKSDARINEVSVRLDSLLPGAMAAGLSAAYEKKKDDEVGALGKFEKNFERAIGFMFFVSLIPFAVDIYLLGVQGKELVQVIKDTPSLVIAILPLYFPVLWMAYSSNKKINLSKRLIEEYTHKAVLGKTFSGLSNQIDSLPHEGPIKEQLRTRLLFNILQVSAENPGKLISNYNKSDHPLMDALENSAKLSDAVDALAKIPGFGALAKKLADKGEELLTTQGQKVANGLSTQETLEPSADEAQKEKQATESA